MLDTLLQMDGWFHASVLGFVVLLPSLYQFHKELQIDDEN